LGGVPAGDGVKTSIGTVIPELSGD
jgi:hypothetical protein